MKFKKETILTAAVFLLITVLLIIIEVRPGFPDPDSFYHAKMAATLRDNGFIKIFPWFQWTSLKEVFVNPHILYHVSLIPFVSFFDPLVGMKISAVVFGLVAFVALYLTLKAIKTPYPALFVLTSALSIGFLHRMSLPRAPSLSVALLLLGTWAIYKKKTGILLATAFIFVWFYHGWPILLLSLGAFLVAEILTAHLLEPKSWLRNIFDGFKKQRLNILATFAGLAGGLILNPYFPQNIYFSIFEIFKIGIVNYQSVIAVGTEWFPKTAGEFLESSLPIFLLFLLTVAFFIPGLLTLKNKKPNFTAIFAFLFLAGGYSVLTFKSSRYVEYAVPFLALSAGSLAVYSWSFWQKELWPTIRNWLKDSTFKKSFSFLLILLIIGLLAFNETKSIANSNDGFRVADYEPAVTWIQNNVPEKEIIFHNCWDYSLLLWYLDDQHYYLVGLDPTFMYDFNQEVYKTWWALSMGEDPEVSKIISEFSSRTVVIDKRFKTAEKFISNLENSGLFERVSANEKVEVYEAIDL